MHLVSLTAPMRSPRPADMLRTVHAPNPILTENDKEISAANSGTIHGAMFGFAPPTTLRPENTVFEFRSQPAGGLPTLTARTAPTFMRLTARTAPKFHQHCPRATPRGVGRATRGPTRDVPGHPITHVRHHFPLQKEKATATASSREQRTPLLMTEPVAMPFPYTMK